MALDAWLKEEKAAREKKRQAEEQHKAGESSRESMPDSQSSKRRRTAAQSRQDLALDDDLEDRLRMGLSVLIELAHEIHKGVLNTSFLQTEPGCGGFCENLYLENTSLLLSVPRRLEPYPGRSSSPWMGKDAVRFHQEQRGTVPAEGAAPAAEGGAPASSDGLPVGASSPAIRSRMSGLGGLGPGMGPMGGKVRSLPGSISRFLTHATAQVTPDQSSHLDALIGGLIVLLNMMPGMAYVGVHLNSGGCIHALKNLIREDYPEFCRQFGVAMTVDGRRLQDVMKGRSYQQKLDMAWELYACEKLAAAGFSEKFQRAYVELEEFEMFLGSMAVFHFGARYPCFCRQEEIPLDWWHLRLHLYIGNRLVRVADAVADGEQFLKNARNKNVVDDAVAQHTIDLFDPPPQWRGLLAVRQFMQLHGNPEVGIKR
jgi:hypothetical protein